MESLIVFDLDGTISDSRDAILATFRHVARDNGLPTPDADAVVSMIGLSLETMFPRLYPNVSDPGQLAADYRARYRVHDAEHTRLFDGAVETLDRLRARGLRLAIATSKRQDGARHTVGRLGIADRFDLVAGDVPERPGKPHPAMLQFVLSELGVTPEAAVMIGDTSYDLEMARRAGVRPVGVAWGAHGAERLSERAPVATDWADLTAHLIGER
ncbi:MAG: HAD-IA family hydrolase [Myxococcota bacterium]